MTTAPGFRRYGQFEVYPGDSGEPDSCCNIRTTRKDEVLPDGGMLYTWLPTHPGFGTLRVGMERRDKDGRLVDKWFTVNGAKVVITFVPDAKNMGCRPCMEEVIISPGGCVTTTYVLAGDYVLRPDEPWAHTRCLGSRGQCVEETYQFLHRMTKMTVDGQYGEELRTTCDFCPYSGQVRREIVEYDVASDRVTDIYVWGEMLRRITRNWDGRITDIWDERGEYYEWCRERVRAKICDDDFCIDGLFCNIKPYLQPFCITKTTRS